MPQDLKILALSEVAGTWTNAQRETPVSPGELSIKPVGKGHYKIITLTS